MFIVKGTGIRTRTIVGSNGEPVFQTLADCLPRHSPITTRQDLAGCDKQNFLEWAKAFVKSVEVTRNGRNVCLVFDGYRSHMGFKVLRMLKEGNVVVYCLPAHTSGATEPPDVAVYSPFKQPLSNKIYSVAGTSGQVEYDQFDFALFITHAYEASFTPQNIKAAFRKTGLWPIDSAGLLHRPLPSGGEEGTSSKTPLSVTAMNQMVIEKRAKVRKGMQLQSVASSRGFLGTTQGLPLTSDEAMSAALAQDREYSQRKAAEERARQVREEKRIAKEAEAAAVRVKTLFPPTSTELSSLECPSPPGYKELTAR